MRKSKTGKEIIERRRGEVEKKWDVLSGKRKRIPKGCTREKLNCRVDSRRDAR
jgi:hypothetical protein